MPANTNPIFPLTPKTGSATLTSANTATDGSGTPTTAFTAGSNGSRIDRIIFVNSQATAAASSAMRGVVFLTDTAGANPKPIGEVAIPAATRTVSVVGSSVAVPIPPFSIASGQLVQATITVRASAADDTTCTVFGGDY